MGEKPKFTVKVQGFDAGNDTYANATGWTVDADGVLTVEGEDGPLATYAAGMFRSVFRERDA